LLKYLPDPGRYFCIKEVIIYHRIESKDNQQLKYFVRLGTETKFRKQSQQAIIYGRHLIEEAIKANLICQLFILDDAIDSFEEILTTYKDVNNKITLLNKSLINKINLLDSSIDCAAIINVKYVHLNQHIVDSNSDYIVFENIQDPGNLGTILRAAQASGINNVIISSNSADIYNPKVIRASQGIQFGLNIISDVNIPDFLFQYKGQVLAMMPTATESLYTCNLTMPTVFLLGNEGNGLSEGIKQFATKQITIPMLGNAESLNLAMAATIAVFEMSRQKLQNGL